MLHRLNSAATLIQRTPTEAPRLHMYYIGLDVHKKTISYCVKDESGRIQQEGTRLDRADVELDGWMKTLPQPWSVGMECDDLQRLDLRPSAAGQMPRRSRWLTR